MAGMSKGRLKKLKIRKENRGYDENLALMLADSKIEY